MENFVKIVHPADENVSYNPDRTRFVPLFAKIELSEDGRLSISGVVGPRSNGNCAGSCGQIIMSFKEYDKRGHLSITDLRPAAGWSRSLIQRFFGVWDRWHLNDMRAGCEHMRGREWNSSKELTIYHFRLSGYFTERVRAAKDRAERALKAGESFIPTREESLYANLKHQITYHKALLPTDLAPYYLPNGPQYTNDHYNRASETKTAGWLTAAEHPEGLLSKPCPTCGYKYGSAWCREDVPAEVVEFLRSLPDTDKQPVWV